MGSLAVAVTSTAQFTAQFYKRPEPHRRTEGWDTLGASRRALMRKTTSGALVAAAVAILALPTETPRKNFSAGRVARVRRHGNAMEKAP